MRAAVKARQRNTPAMSRAGFELTGDVVTAAKGGWSSEKRSHAAKV